MAVDEALLLSVARAKADPVLRVYSFSPPAVSVGRFQDTSHGFDFDAMKRDGVSFVRRPSGGQAVLHDGEITYCVVMGDAHIDNFGKRAVYRFIVPLLLNGLASLGVRAPRSAGNPRGDATNPDCFASTSEYEIDSQDGRKLVGSAQMVVRGAVLQHGSIPLDDSNRRIARYLHRDAGRDLQPSNLREQGAPPLTKADATAKFASALAAVLPSEFSELTPEEIALAGSLHKDKYTKDGWNRKH